MLALARVVQMPVDGSHTSVGKTGDDELSNPPPLLPPVTSTVPSGSSVPLCWRRANPIDAVFVHLGEDEFRSMVSAVLVGGSPPPAYKILPASYITAGAKSRYEKM